jgi:RND family efflux transporter MFP subunit
VTNRRAIVTKHDSGRATRGAAILWLIGVVAALAVGGFLVWGGRDEKGTTEIALSWTAAQEKLRIAVVESGQLKAARSTDIYCKLRGGATILELVDEGVKVSEGDVVVRLDAKNLEDDLTAQKIKYQNALAARIQAEKAHAIQESKNQSDTDKAALDKELAKTDLDKYIEGDFPLKQKEAESNVKLAESELLTADKKAKETKQLVELDFAAETELQGDELDLQRCEVAKSMAIEKGKLLEKFEKPRQVQVLESDVRAKDAELDRVKLRCEADIAQKLADWESKKATFDLEESKLAELEQQLVNTTILAPTAGLVVYPLNQGGGMGGRGGSDRDRVEEGATVRENQLLLSLPDTSEMVVSVNVHESAVDKVRVGQPAIVMIDAATDRSFLGKVTFVAPLPDTQNQWLNPDLKVYRCEITLEGGAVGLKPGMSASAEIIIDELPDAIALPIHAVYRRGDHYFVYVVAAEGKAAIREVKLGLHNDQRVAISEGLAAGEKVYLSVPPGAPQPDFPADAKAKPETSVDELRQRAAAIQGKPTSEMSPGASGPTAAMAMPTGIDFSEFAQLKGKSEEEQTKWWADKLATLTPEQKTAWEAWRARMKSMGAGGNGASGRGNGGDGGPRNGRSRDGKADAGGASKGGGK